MTRNEIAAWLKRREMTHEQYRRCIAELNLNQLAAGRFLGVSQATAQRYADGRSTVPVVTALLLRRLVDDGLDLGEW